MAWECCWQDRHKTDLPADLQSNRPGLRKPGTAASLEKMSEGYKVCQKFAQEPGTSVRAAGSLARGWGAWSGGDSVITSFASLGTCTATSRPCKNQAALTQAGKGVMRQCGPQRALQELWGGAGECW